VRSKNATYVVMVVVGEGGGRGGGSIDLTLPYLWYVLPGPISQEILGLQPRDKAAMSGVNTMEFFLEEFTWK